MQILKYSLIFLLCFPVQSGHTQSTSSLSGYRHYFPGGECDSLAFNYAWRGYRILLERGMLNNSRYLSIIDFTRPSQAKRFFVLDTRRQKTVISSITAHGVGSDPDSCTVPYRFSNHNGSKSSSVGFYVTGSTYTNNRPQDSTGLCLFGLDKDYNDSAVAREIVVHYGATEYAGRVYVSDSGAARSYGCPALPLSSNSRVITLIRGGSCLFIYSDRVIGYAKRSTVLNNRLKGPIVQTGPPPNNCSCQIGVKKKMGIQGR